MMTRPGCFGERTWNERVEGFDLQRHSPGDVRRSGPVVSSNWYHGEDIGYVDHLVIGIDIV